MLPTVLLVVIVYVLAGLGFSKVWARAVDSLDTEMEIVCCIFWPIGLLVCSVWSW